MVRSLFSTGQKLFTKQSSSILSAATIITGANLASALLGFLRNRLLVSHFFETQALRQQLDAYWVAFRIPELVFQLLVIGAMSAAFIPVYSKYREKNEADANRMATSMMNIVLLVFVVLSLVIFFNAEFFNGMITSTNFSAEQVKTAASLTRVMLLAQLFFAASNFMTGIIQAHERFLVPAISPLMYNIGIIIGIVFLTPVFGIYGPAIGVVLGAALHFMIQFPLAFHLGFRPRPIIDWRHQGVREMFRLMPPRALAISVDQLELFASVYFTTALPAGNLTILNLAQQLMTAPTRVFSVPIGQASLPFLSRDAARGEISQFRETLTHTLNQVFFLAFPASALLLVLRVPLVRIAYGTAVFPWSATLMTGRLVAIFALAIFAYGGIQVLARAFYSLHDTKTPFFIGLGSALLSITLMTLGAKVFSFGILGIGTALCLSAISQFLWLFVVIQLKYKAINLLLLWRSLLRIVSAAAIMGFALWAPMRLLDAWLFDTTRTLPLIGLTVIVGLIGGLVYLLLAKLFAIPEYALYWGILGKLGKWRTVLSETQEVLESTSQTDESKSW